MPPKKKQPKNSYYFYMMEYRDKMEARGKRFPGGNKQVADEAAPFWKNLTKEERFPYEEQARAYKLASKLDHAHKYTSTGETFAQIDKEAKEMERLLELENSEITSTIRCLDLDTIKTKQFHVIHVNYYCKVNDMFLPCEVAVCSYSLKNGFGEHYHAIINPGEVPVGYLYDAKKESEETHQIPVPPHDMGEKDYYSLLQNIKKVVQSPDGSIPPLYTRSINVDSIKNVLGMLCENSNLDFDYFRIYPLHKLFFELKNHCAIVTDDKSSILPVNTLAERELEKDVFSYRAGLACEFHQGTEKYHFCSLSFIKRWCFILSDHCCKIIGVSLIPGKHIPCNTDSDYLSKARSSERKFCVNADAQPDRVTVIDRSIVKPPPTSVINLSTTVASSRNIGEQISSYSSSVKTPGPDAAFYPNDFPSIGNSPKLSDIVSVKKGSSQTGFTTSDFPPIGLQARKHSQGVADHGIVGRVPKAVAGRGAITKFESTQLTIGRGRGLAATFENLKLN